MTLIKTTPENLVVLMALNDFELLNMYDTNTKTGVDA